MEVGVPIPAQLETAYNEAEEAPIQKYSVLLKSRVGGPKLLLCPVPDQRIKQRDRDEFVGLVMLAPSVKQVADAAEKAIAVALEEIGIGCVSEPPMDPPKNLNFTMKRLGGDPSMFGLDGQKEEQKKDEEEKEKLLLAGKKPEDIKKGTVARPAVQMAGSDARIDDGVGNIVTVMDNGAFKSSLA
eukprot:s601_g7.t1